jgi:hypothetical protein
MNPGSMQGLIEYRGYIIIRHAGYYEIVGVTKTFRKKTAAESYIRRLNKLR